MYELLATELPDYLNLADYFTLKRVKYAYLIWPRLDIGSALIGFSV